MTTLPEGKASLFAFFTDRKHAQGAKEALLAAGIEHVQLDRFSFSQGEGAQRLNNPLTGRIDSLADMTGAYEADSPDEGIVTAADPDASGFARSQRPERAWQLTVVVPDEQVSKAREILQDHDADL